MHWTAGFQSCLIAHALGPPPVMCTVKPLVNASRRCLFLLGVALAAIAPAYSQGYIVPNGVTYSTAGLSAVIHVMQSPTNGDYTGFILRPQFKTPGSPYYTICLL